jgi:uracil-DNA glycosylase
MHAVTLRQPDDPDEFRFHARRLLAAAIDPADVIWNADGSETLFSLSAAADSASGGERVVLVPRAFADLADAVVCHRDAGRWALLYRALWRIGHGERRLMEQAADPLVHRLHQMAAAVRRDQHRMTAFVRFRLLPGSDDSGGGAGAHYIAWHEPRHRVLRRASSFFIDRFASMRFSILTPDLTLHWDRAAARFTPGLRREDAVSADAVEDWWRRYYAAVFNPARVNAGLMSSHMPKQYWRNLPEAAVIAELVRTAGTRTGRMLDVAEVGDRDRAGQPDQT